MQLIQLNLNRCRAAQDLLKQTVRELGSEVASPTEWKEVTIGSRIAQAKRHSCGIRWQHRGSSERT